MRLSRQSGLAALGLLLMFGAVFGGGGAFGERFLGLPALVSHDLFWWSMFFAVLLYVGVVERRPLSSIGLKRPSWKTLAFGIGGAFVLFEFMPVVFYASQLLHLPLQQNSGTAKVLASAPYWHRLLIVLRASLAEEVVFRGFAMERIEELTGSRIAGFLLPLAVFIAAHAAGWGWLVLLGVGVAGTVLGLLYLWRRDLGANMIAHFIIDGVQLLA